MFNPAILFALGVVAAVMYLPRSASRVRWARSLRKTLPVALFAVAAFAENAPLLLVGALGASAVGDLALSRPSAKAFLAGMVAFAASHLAYVVLMVSLGSTVDVGQWPVVVVIILVGMSTEWWLRPHTGALKWPVRGYVLSILLMAVVSLGLPDLRHVAIWGAGLFVVSDLILAIETFVMADNDPRRKWANKLVWVTYIGAQIGLFWGLGAL